MTIDDAVKVVRQSVRTLRAASELEANKLEAAMQLLLTHAGDEARRQALDTAARVIREL